MTGEEANVLDGTRYRAIGELGRGGMGTVLLAEHRMLKSRLAVKLLHAELAMEDALVDRLRVEAEVLARVSSPHVVNVLDCGVTAGGEPFIAMELLTGRSLHDELKARGAFPVKEALDLARQATRGVMAAHALGIVHRDLKPANLFYCGRTGEPPLLKVLDFGVAKILSGPVAPPKVATALGTMVGSPKTMSPEACIGEGVDERSDIYSLGVVLYMLLAGRAPFEGRRDFVEFARAHVTEKPEPPSAFAEQSIPDAVDALVLRALEKDPARRFQTAAELEAALTRALEDGATAVANPVTPNQLLVTEPLSVSSSEHQDPTRIPGPAPTDGSSVPKPGESPALPLHHMAASPSEPTRLPSWLPWTITGFVTFMALGGLALFLMFGRPPAPSAAPAASQQTPIPPSTESALRTAPLPRPAEPSAPSTPTPSTSVSVVPSTTSAAPGSKPQPMSIASSRPAPLTTPKPASSTKPFSEFYEAAP